MMLTQQVWEHRLATKIMSSMTKHRCSTPDVLRNSEKSNEVDLQRQELFPCIRQTKVYTDTYRKRNGKELQCLPLTLAFIKAVKTTRMSGSPSPFTSHSSSGDNTPPATVTENHHTVVKKATQPIFHAGRGGPAQERETHGQPNIMESAREPPMSGSSHHNKMFHCMERQKCSISVRKRKGKNGGGNRRRFLHSTSLSEVMWEPHILRRT